MGKMPVGISDSPRRLTGKAVFLFQTSGPWIFEGRLSIGSPTRLTKLLKAFFPEELLQYFWKPCTSDYVAQGSVFYQKNGPILLEAPHV